MYLLYVSRVWKCFSRAIRKQIVQDLIQHENLNQGYYNKIASALTIGQCRRFMLEIDKAIVWIAYNIMDSVQMKINPGLQEKYNNLSSREQKK